MNVNALIYWRSIIIILAVSILLTGCSGYQYVASPRFVPLNEKKGELTANLYPSGVQAGYAFSNKFSVFAMGFRRVPTEFRSTTLIQGIEGRDRRSCNSTEINIGLSYFKKKDNYLYEILVGGGLGKINYANEFQSDKNQSTNYTFKLEADRKNVFIQPNFSYKFNKPEINRHLSIGVFTKFNFLQYYNIKTHLNRSMHPPDNLEKGVNYFITRTEANLFFIEPGIIVKGGSKNFKGMYQISPVLNVSGHAMHYKIFSFNIGFTMNLDLLKEKNKG